MRIRYKTALFSLSTATAGLIAGGCVCYDGIVILAEADGALRSKSTGEPIADATVIVTFFGDSDVMYSEEPALDADGRFRVFIHDWFGGCVPILFPPPSAPEYPALDSVRIDVTRNGVLHSVNMELDAAAFGPGGDRYVDLGAIVLPGT